MAASFCWKEQLDVTFVPLVNAVCKWARPLLGDIDRSRTSVRLRCRAYGAIDGMPAGRRKRPRISAGDTKRTQAKMIQVIASTRYGNLSAQLGLRRVNEAQLRVLDETADG